MSKRGAGSFDTWTKTGDAGAPRLPDVPRPEEFMRRTSLIRALPLALIALLVIPSLALADGTTDGIGFAGKLPTETGLNSVWVIVAGCLVMFMQAGFAFLEIGFVRGKNAGSVIA